MGADVIAKNLLENKLCSGCKFYDQNTQKCQRFEPLELSSTDDVEVYLNGMLVEENEIYVITNNMLYVLQHQFDAQMMAQPMTGYNNTGLNPADRIIVIVRTIEKDRIKKETYRLNAGKDIPHEQTCEGFLSNKNDTNYRS